MAYTKKVAPKKSKKAVKKVTAKKIVVPKIGKVKKTKPLLNPISPKKSTGVKPPPLSEKEKALLNVRNGQSPYVVHVTNTDTESSKSKPVVLGTPLPPFYESSPEKITKDYRKLISGESTPKLDNMKRVEPVTLTPPNIYQLPVLDQSLKRRNTAFDLNRQERDSVAISVTIRNVTNYTLKNVKLFDKDFLNQRDVIYSTANENLNYADVLMRKNALSEPVHHIGITHITGNNSGMQIFRTHTLSDTSIDGVLVAVPITPMIDPNQNQIGVTVLRYEIPFYVGMDLSIEYLNPDEKITYNFFLKTY